MKLLRTFIIFAVLWTVCLWGAQAHADLLQSLFNTGVDGTGAPLRAGSTDPHYYVTMVTSAPVTPFSAYITQGGWPLNGPWVSNTASAQWIGPIASIGGYAGDGDFRYRTTFDLTSYNPSTTVISGQWSSDNAGMQIYLNGKATNIVHPGEFAYQGWELFTITSGFKQGVNTLDFYINNLPNGTINPTGLIVQMKGTAEPVPILGAIWLFAPALLGLIELKRRYLLG